MRTKRLLPLTRKKRQGMVPEQFYLLRAGDIIRGVKPGGSYRKIEGVSLTEDGRTSYIRLLKLRRSWTNSPYTLYCAGDASMFVPIKVKNDLIWEITFESAMERRRHALKGYYAEKAEEARKRLNKYLSYEN